jgi:hypothetical protein
MPPDKQIFQKPLPYFKKVKLFKLLLTCYLQLKTDLAVFTAFLRQLGLCIVLYLTLFGNKHGLTVPFAMCRLLFFVHFTIF